MLVIKSARIRNNIASVDKKRKKGLLRQPRSKNQFRMKLKEVIKKIFKPYLDPDRHKVLVCDSVAEFLSVVRSTSEHDRKSVYIYLGEASVLAGIVGSECGRGEKDINSLSLVYADTDMSVGDCIYLDEAFLDPCDVADLKPRSGRFDLCTRIRFDKNGEKSVEIKKAVICHSGVYLTTK